MSQIDFTKLDHLEDKYLKEILEKYSPENRIVLSPNLQKLALELDLLNIKKIEQLTPENELFFLAKVKELNYGSKNMPRIESHKELVPPFFTKLYRNPSQKTEHECLMLNRNCALHFEKLSVYTESRLLQKYSHMAKDLKSVDPSNQVKVAHKDPASAIRIKNLTEEATEIILEKNHRFIIEVPNPQISHLLYALNKEFLELQSKNISISNYEGIVDKGMLTLYKRIPSLSHFETYDDAINYLKKHLYLQKHL